MVSRIGSERPKLHLPEYVYIRSKRWTVDIVQQEDFECEDKTFGQCDPNTRTILILEGQPPRQMLGTFLHEFIHACEFEWGVKIPHRMVYFIERRLTPVVWRLIILNQA